MEYIQIIIKGVTKMLDKFETICIRTLMVIGSIVLIPAMVIISFIYFIIGLILSLVSTENIPELIHTYKDICSLAFSKGKEIWNVWFLETGGQQWLLVFLLENYYVYSVIYRNINSSSDKNLRGGNLWRIKKSNKSLGGLEKSNFLFFFFAKKTVALMNQY